MIAACPAPTGGAVAVDLAAYLDCQARVLGENGFQSLVGGPVAGGLLSGLVTIFVALIGYRLILGRELRLDDLIGAAVRLGLVLALVTGWPAFQTLVYNVAVDAPAQLAQRLLPASGLPADGLEGQVQAAYDAMRLGLRAETQPAPANPAAAGPVPNQAGQPPQTQALVQLAPPLPRTALVFVVSTVAVAAAFKLAVGFLLAIAPLPLLGLLFRGTLGLFFGWVRVLAGAALAVLGATVVMALDLVLVAGELARLTEALVSGASTTVDPLALTVIVYAGALAMLVVTLLALRLPSALGLRWTREPAEREEHRPSVVMGNVPALLAGGTAGAVAQGAPSLPAANRVTTVVDALNAAARREAIGIEGAGGGNRPSLAGGASGGRTAGDAADPVSVTSGGTGATPRRRLGRPTRSSSQRDRRG